MWNHRVIKTTYTLDDEEYTSYAIHEVYYKEDGSIEMWTEKCIPAVADTLEDLDSVLEMQKQALKKPVLIEKNNTLVEI